MLLQLIALLLASLGLVLLRRLLLLLLLLLLLFLLLLLLFLLLLLLFLRSLLHCKLLVIPLTLHLKLLLLQTKITVLITLLLTLLILLKCKLQNLHHLRHGVIGGLLLLLLSLIHGNDSAGLLGNKHFRAALSNDILSVWRNRSTIGAKASEFWKRFDASKRVRRLLIEVTRSR